MPQQKWWKIISWNNEVQNNAFINQICQFTAAVKLLCVGKAKKDFIFYLHKINFVCYSKTDFILHEQTNIM